MKQKTASFVTLAVLTIVTVLLGIDYFQYSKDENLKNEIQLRKIGHEVLISANDYTSKVLPIKTISDNEFQISFENEFAFVPDSIINIVKKNISKGSFPKEYTVSVQKCSNKAIVYGFHIVPDSTKNVITCKGRNMPLDCYVIHLNFSSESVFSYSSFIFIIAQVLGLSLFFLIRSRIMKRKKQPTTTNDEDSISIGNYSFYFKKHQLQFEKELISLTPKESKLLYLLSLSPNEIIDRTTLQKEIWENEGVIVTRSLDMFISKLRKKLDKDSSITIVNIHGVGYKLEINS